MQRLALILIGFAGVVACAEREPEPRYAPAAREMGVDNERSISAITNARCDRESRCGNIGADRRYENREQCLRELNESGYDSLGNDDCPRGIDRNELSQCLEEVRNENCNNVIDKIERVAACRSAELCVD